MILGSKKKRRSNWNNIATLHNANASSQLKHKQQRKPHLSGDALRDSFYNNRTGLELCDCTFTNEALHKLHINLKGLHVQIGLFVRNETAHVMNSYEHHQVKMVHWFTMSKVWSVHRTWIQVYTIKDHQMGNFVFMFVCDTRQGLWFSPPAPLHVQTIIITTTKISHNATADVILTWTGGWGGVYDILQTNGDLNGNESPSVMWQEWHDLAVALYECILTLPIQKAHIYTHTTKR